MKKFKLTFAYNGEAESWEQIRNDAENNKLSKVLIGTKEFVNVVRCKDCRWGKEACGNIECTVDIGSTWAEYHGYEWFCPNGERKGASR